MKCANCGAKIKKKYNVCPNCGGKNEMVEPQKMPLKFYKIIIGLLIVALVAVASCIILPYFLRPNVEELKKSVVQIYVYDSTDEVIATGSGVVAFEDDIIITNAHVVEGNHKLEIISENNTKYQVEGIIGYNKKKDIAILKLNENKGLKALATKESLSVGDDVIAIGSPLGLKNTVSNGIFSGYFQDEIEVYQHTAPISQGSSGGALFDNKGKLVGITYASIDNGQNINFAIPIKAVQNEYNLVKNNTCLDTQYYKYLNNGILKTQMGSQLMDYVLNDEYGNDPFKSGIQNERVHGYLTLSSLNNEFYWYGNGFDEIEKYVASSVYINSGVPNRFYADEDGEISLKEGNYYAVIIIKLKDSSDLAVEAIKKYFISDLHETEKYYMQHGKDYIYLLDYQNYDNIDKVKRIMETFI